MSRISCSRRLSFGLLRTMSKTIPESMCKNQHLVEIYTYRTVFLMIRRIAIFLCLLGSIGIEAQQSYPRAIRRDVPMTNAIRRAYEAGTRNSTGRPGPNYWQLQTDYRINVRLDPETQTITGTETITLHNNSPQALTEILLRLD